MPTLLLQNGYRFFFYSNENDEPIHVHVIKGDAMGKIWLDPEISISYMIGFSSREENIIMQIVNERYKFFKQKWHEYFTK